MFTSGMLSLILALSEIRDSESLRFAYSAEQGFDTSCGLSSLSCLLSTYWDIPSSEIDLARDFLAGKTSSGDYTVSFADMVAILNAKGFVTAAYRMDFDQLAAAVAKYAPIVVHYDRPDGHFALGVEGSTIVTADPAEGTVAVERGIFESRWSGNVLLAARPGSAPDRKALQAAIRSVLGRRALLDRLSLSESSVGSEPPQILNADFAQYSNELQSVRRILASPRPPELSRRPGRARLAGGVGLSAPMPHSPGRQPGAVSSRARPKPHGARASFPLRSLTRGQTLRMCHGPVSGSIGTTGASGGMRT